MKRTNIFYLLIFLCLSIFTVKAQTLKTFKGNYEKGTATYQYYENSQLERIFSGTFKYKGSVAGGIKGKSSLSATGQFKENKKDGIWKFVLTDPDPKGSTETVTGTFVNGNMDGLWTSTSIGNLSKKTIRKSSATFKDNKLTGQLSFDYTVSNLKDFSSISFLGFLDDASLFDGIWTAKYTLGNIQYEESRKYRNGILYFLIHRRLSDGKILEKIDSTFFTDQFFQNYNSEQKVSTIRGQKYVFSESNDRYTGELTLPIAVTEFWSSNLLKTIVSPIPNINPAFMYDYGQNYTTIFHEKKIINWSKTAEGARQGWEQEQSQKANEEKYKQLLARADTAFAAKLFVVAIQLYNESLTLKESTYARDQIQKSQSIVEQERIRKEQEKLAKEQEQRAKDKAYDDYILKADQNFKDKKFEAALEFYKSALQIKANELYPQKQIDQINSVRVEETRLAIIAALDKEWIPIEGGSFKLGAFRSDLLALTNEEPISEVSLNPFFITKTEITNKLYRDYCKVMNLPFQEGADDLPAVNMTWEEANAFAKWLGFRLPTEAQWEYVAKGGTKGKKLIYSGSNSIEKVAWYNANANQTTHSVGTLLPNSIGVFDMSGNVWEWCSDWYGDYTPEDKIDPKGPETGSRKVKRGGSFSETNFETDLRITNRGSEPTSFKSYNLGFRLVK